LPTSSDRRNHSNFSLVTSWFFPKDFAQNREWSVRGINSFTSCLLLKWLIEVNRLSYSWCDKFNLYKTDQSLCPLCLCGSFHSLASGNVSENRFYPPNPREPQIPGKGLRGFCHSRHKTKAFNHCTSIS
jgi:hypothetical protein